MMIYSRKIIEIWKARISLDKFLGKSFESEKKIKKIKFR